MAWFFRVKYKNWAKAKKDYPAIFKDSGLIADKRNDYFKFYMLLASWWNMDYYLNYGNNINEDSNNKCIAVKSPMDAQTVSDQIEKVSNARTPYLDGKIFSMTLILAYRLGLKRQEIIDLNIGDIMKGRGTILKTITINDAKIDLSDDLQSIIHNHIKYLRIMEYNLKKEAPLIPMRSKKRYHSRQLGYDSRKIYAECSVTPQMEKFRQAGICHYYEKLIKEGDSPSKALERASHFARRTQRQTLGIITGTMYKENKLQRHRPTDAW